MYRNPGTGPRVETGTNKKISNWSSPYGAWFFASFKTLRAQSWWDQTPLLFTGEPTGLPGMAFTNPSWLSDPPDIIKLRVIGPGNDQGKLSLSSHDDTLIPSPPAKPRSRGEGTFAEAMFLSDWNLKQRIPADWGPNIPLTGVLCLVRTSHTEVQTEESLMSLPATFSRATKRLPLDDRQGERVEWCC